MRKPSSPCLIGLQTLLLMVLVIIFILPSFVCHEIEFRFTGQKKTNLKASTKTRNFSTHKNHEQTTNYFYSTYCKRLISLVLTLDCMSCHVLTNSTDIPKEKPNVLVFRSTLFDKYLQIHGKHQSR